MNELILIKASTREYPSRSLRRTPNSRKSLQSSATISVLIMIFALSVLLGTLASHPSYGVSTSSNTTQTSTSTFTTSSISIAFDLPTAAVVTFVLILLGLAVGLLLMMRLSDPDLPAM